MPDHVHLLAEGLEDRSDLNDFVHRAKQKSGYAYSREQHARLWQPSFYDRVLRDDEATIDVVRYIFENPVRANLVIDYREYPHLGSATYSREQVFESLVNQPARRWQP